MRLFRNLVLITGLFLFYIPLANAEPYFGLAMGANVLIVNKSLSYANSSANPSDSLTGFRGQFLFGYNFHTMKRDFSVTNEELFSDCGYFAIELGLGYNGGTTSATTTNWFGTTSASTEEELHFSYDLFVLYKYHTHNITLFLGPGITTGDFKINLKSQTAGNLGASTSDDENLLAWSLKFGIEVPININIDGVLAFQYSNFQNVTLTDVEPLTGENVTAKYRPRLYSVTLGLNFH